MTHTLPELSYAFNALEPYFDHETMIIHHSRHHQAYVDNLNKAISGSAAENQGLENILHEISKYPAVVRNNAGGHYNHSLFWQILSPTASHTPKNELAEKIDLTFGSLENLKSEIKAAGIAQFGSGWAWLSVDNKGGLVVTATPNQDNPLMDVVSTDRMLPILGVDVWEHAYYLKYQNKRADYLDAFWSVLDWTAVEKNYLQAISDIK